MRPFIEKILSRKFLISLAAFLSSLGTSIVGLATSEPTVATIGLICSVVSAALYSAIEASVDKAKGGERDADK